MAEEFIDLRLVQLHVRSFICFDKLDLKFDENYTLLIGNENAAGKSAIIKAIKFIVSNEFIGKNSALLLQKKSSDKSFVKITFEYRNNDTVKTIDAWRTFSSIDLITYRYDNEINTVPIGKFQKTFKLNAFFLRKYLDYDINDKNENKNLLHFLGESAGFYTPFEENVNNVTNHSETDELISYLQLQKKIMDIEETKAWELYRKMIVTVSNIFKKLTYDRYEIIFKEDNKNEGKLISYVKNLYDGIELIWTETEGHLRFLLLISVKIAISIIENQKFIFIDSTNSFKDAQNFEFVQSCLIKKRLETNQSNSNDDDQEENEEDEIEEINYLQRIINICNEFKIIVFFECRSDTIATNCNIIDCFIQNGKPKCIRHEIIEDNIDYFREMIFSLFDENDIEWLLEMKSRVDYV